MKVFQTLPRHMRFNKGQASSVELCVSEWVSGSRFRNQTTVFAEADDEPLIDVAIHRWKPAQKLVSWQTALEIRREVARRGCDLIIVQQHIATAARIAAFNPGVPVILSTHNFVEGRGRGAYGRWRDGLVRQRFGRLRGMTLISEAARHDFEQKWPGIGLPRAVVPNGFDFSQWRPRKTRDKQVLVVGRAMEGKGLLEAATAIIPFLADHPDWRATFALSAPQQSPAYFEAIRTALSASADRVDLLVSVPYARIRELSAACAIAIVPSTWNEPFGRTALEAHAGGAALISSGSGGLREISGDCAFYIETVSPRAIEDALRELAADETLRERLATAGTRRVRDLFRISGASERIGSPPSICERLDAFCEEVVAGFRPTAMPAAPPPR